MLFVQLLDATLDSVSLRPPPGDYVNFRTFSKDPQDFLFIRSDPFGSLYIVPLEHRKLMACI